MPEAIENLVKPPETTVQSELAQLAGASEDDLYAQLGRLSLANREPGMNASELVYKDEATNAQFGTLGRRIFNGWSRALHQIICGDGEAAKDIRGKISEALTKGNTVTIPAMIGVVLSRTFGLDVQFASIIGLLLNEVVLKPLGTEFCRLWGNKLDG